jgi:sarcosine oxidase, subunit delta
MKIMPCPLNGPRNISEFAYGGEVEDMPDPATCSDEEWSDFVFFRNNAATVVREWWYHTPTSYWFIAERDTRTDEIVRTYPASEIYNRRVEFTRPEEQQG